MYFIIKAHNASQYVRALPSREKNTFYKIQRGKVIPVTGYGYPQCNETSGLPHFCRMQFLQKPYIIKKSDKFLFKADGSNPQLLVPRNFAAHMGRFPTIIDIGLNHTTERLDAHHP
jgi:hypothetical protein